MTHPTSPPSDVVLRIEGNAAGVPCPEQGEYIVSLRVPKPGHPGIIVTTPHIEKARRFPDAGAALEYWRQEHGTRWTDGKPNRPLTAFHVSILPAGALV